MSARYRSPGRQSDEPPPQPLHPQPGSTRLISEIPVQPEAASTAPLVITTSTDDSYTSPSSPDAPRVRYHKAQLDVRLLDYVSPCNTNLICLICHCPFDNPVRLECDHVFCDDCLKQAIDTQSNTAKACPTCRSPVNQSCGFLPVPRIIKRMLDELTVKCPNHELGCRWVDIRANVETHLDRYCDYTLVECSSSECRLGVPQKDAHKGCLHYTVNCEFCDVSLLQMDVESHQRESCSNRSMSCPDCGSETLRLDVEEHMNRVCPRTVLNCPGAPCGCSYNCERSEMEKHSSQCPIARMVPYLQSQKSRQDELEATQKILQRKVDILEGGFNAMQSMLYNYNSSPTGTGTTADAFLPAHTPSDTTLNASEPANPPFESPTHHLLSLYESLREEVSRISREMSDVEGRTSVMILNEQLRAKEEMAHTNAAINAMRMQLHWLTSARLQAQNRASTASGTAGPSTSVNRTMNSNMASSGHAQLHQIRRPSDSIRQDTKL